MFSYLPPELQDRYNGYAQALSAFEKDMSKACEGGAGGGCLEDDEPSQAPSKPTPGAAPRALGAALEAQKQQQQPPAAPVRKSKPARGSFAEMAASY